MEPITLCGLVIVMFGLWVEFEADFKTVGRVIHKFKLFTGAVSNSEAQKPVYVRRMPICLAKGAGG